MPLRDGRITRVVKMRPSHAAHVLSFRRNFRAQDPSLNTSLRIKSGQIHWRLSDLSMVFITMRSMMSPLQSSSTTNIATTSYRIKGISLLPFTMLPIASRRRYSSRALAPRSVSISLKTHSIIHSRHIKSN